MKIVVLLIAQLWAVNLCAQGFLRAEGKEIVNAAGEPYLLRGMGLGGYMVQEGYMMQTTEFAPTQHQLRALVNEMIGAEATEAWYQAWRDNYLREADVEKMHEMGFNSIRLPMHYNLYTLPIEDEPVAGGQTWLEEGFARTDSLVAWCKAREMYVILDLHAAPGGQGDDVAISDRDLSKPALWESPANLAKTVALWRRLAEHYADEPTIGGYDLLNEVNYDLPGNVALRSLYGRITDTIREVDRNHLLIIEGNGFANDYTGLTPPWDDNMAYSPHKYWSFNDQATIQFMLDLREEQGVPLYLGETGENSNHWFRNAASLYEDFNIGYAWWPWKKLTSVVGPVSSPKNDGYDRLLEFWKGNAPRPTATEAREALFGVAENLRLENSDFQQDVGDALFRQTVSNATIPYLDAIAIPGVLQPVDYDMGRVGFAYDDTELATYWISIGGGFTSWNNGWAYRNDGVDIEASQDAELTNGYNVGWIADDEWMQYTVRVAEDGVYQLRIRAASGSNGGGALSLRLGDASLSGPIAMPPTGGWQTWRDVVVGNIPLAATDTLLRLYADQGGFNLGAIEFTKTGELSAVDTRFVAARTLDFNTIRLTLNKPLDQASPLNGPAFTVVVNDEAVSVTDALFVDGDPRSLMLVADVTFRSSDDIRVTYGGEALLATDGTPLRAFEREPVVNDVLAAYAIPGVLQAEDFYLMSGVGLETTTDEGGGQNAGFLDVGDYLEYNVEVAEAGTYAVDYRTASDGSSGGLTLQLVDSAGAITDLQTVTFAPTGGWQRWVTTAGPELSLPAGRQRLRLTVTAPGFNLNYLTFSRLTSTSRPDRQLPLRVSPNPAVEVLLVSGELPAPKALRVLLVDGAGWVVSARQLPAGRSVSHSISVAELPRGVYYLRVTSRGGAVFTERVVVN